MKCSVNTKERIRLLVGLIRRFLMSQELVHSLLEDRRAAGGIAMDRRTFLRKHIESAIQLDDTFDLRRISVSNVFFDCSKSLDDDLSHSNAVVDVVLHLNSQAHEKVLNYADDIV